MDKALLRNNPLSYILITLSILSINFFSFGITPASAANIPYSITYDDGVVSDMPVDIADKTLNSTVSISSNSPTLSGKKFLGWCNSVPTTTDGIDSCSGTAYQPSSNLSIDQTGTGNNFHFYAMWQEEKTIANSTTMQEVASCSDTIPLETVYTLTDPRDNQTYKVARLKDGKCWMVENLNLTGGTALSADDTDVTSAYINSFTTSNNLTKDGNTIKLPASDDTGFDQTNYSFVYNSGNTTDCGASEQNTPCYSYYSWDAATLGSGRTITRENTDASYSICPKGWRLPTSGDSSNNEWKRGDFYKLATAYGANLESNYSENSSTFYNNAGQNTTVPKFLLAGRYFFGSFGNGGSYGLYWSSTSASSISSARYLRFSSSLVSSADGSDRRIGSSVRCLFKN